MRKVIISSLLLSFFFSLFFVNSALAQNEEPWLPFPEETPSPSPTVTPDPNIATPVSPQPSASLNPEPDPTIIGGVPANVTRFENLQKKYFELLESYRTQEQIFTVAKAQYVQLNTLASQELAVKETRTLIDIRADIFIVYLDMLEEILSQTKGIPLENKTPQLVKIQLLRESVLLHKNINTSALDRLTLDAESLKFKATITNLQREAYYSLSLIRLGRVQHAFDKLLSVRAEVEKDVMGRDLSSSQRAQKERGFNEIQRTTDLTNTRLTPIASDVFKKQNVRSLGDFSSLTSELNPVFSGINQTVEFLQEIRK